MSPAPVGSPLRRLSFLMIETNGQCTLVQGRLITPPEQLSFASALFLFEQNANKNNRFKFSNLGWILRNVSCRWGTMFGYQSNAKLKRRSRIKPQASTPFCRRNVDATDAVSQARLNRFTARRKGEEVRSKAGFSLTELVVVLAIILVVSGLSLPSISRTIDKARLNSAAQQVASIYQQGRIRATQDNNYYILPVSAAGVQPSQVCLDLDGNGVCSANEPQAQLPPEVSIDNRGIPVDIDPVTLGFTQQLTRTDSSTGYNQQGTAEPGLAFNSLGIPCQRSSSTSPCLGPIAWVQYLQLRHSDELLYAAVTVSPTGLVKIWHYANGGAGSGWF